MSTPPPRKMKERPYIRSVKRLSFRHEKPRFRIVKIDRDGRRRQLVISVVNADVLPFIEKQFLQAP